MTVSMYVGISVCVLVLYILHRIDKNDEKVREVKCAKKPDIELMHRKSVKEIEQMYRDSLSQLRKDMDLY